MTRARRPKLPRSEPHRSFAGVFSPASPPNGSGAGRGKPGGSPRPSARKTPGVSGGVAVGYQVIEDYIRQGQQFARKFWSAAPGAPANARDNIADRMVRSASDLASLFSEFLQTVTVPADRRPPGSAPIPDFGLPKPGQPRAARPERPANPAPNGGASAVAAAAPAIWIDVRSRRPVEVSVDLRPGPPALRLIAHDLRAAGVTSARVKAPRIEVRPNEHRVIVRLQIRDGQPAGVYSGTILDGGTNLPRGTVAVRIDGKGRPA